MMGQLRAIVRVDLKGLQLRFEVALELGFGVGA
jgi:hypothetical protein